MKVEIDVDELSRNQIAGLKKEINKLLRQVDRLRRENDQLKANKKEVNDALAEIKAFAEGLPEGLLLKRGEVVQKSAALESMLQGKGPQSEEEWKELGQYLGTIAGFLGVVNAELDYVGQGMDVMEKLFEVLADAQTPETKALMKEVVIHAYQSPGISVSEVQGEDKGEGVTGPTEPDEGWLLP